MGASSLGYTEGSSIEISTHKLPDINGKEQHMQRIAPGCGVVDHMQFVEGCYDKNSTSAHFPDDGNAGYDMIDITGMSRVVVVPLFDDIASPITIHAYLGDSKGRPMGKISAELSNSSTLADGHSFDMDLGSDGVVAVTTAYEEFDVTYFAGGVGLVCTIAGSTVDPLPAAPSTVGEVWVAGTATFVCIGNAHTYNAGDPLVISNTVGASKLHMWVANPDNYDYSLMWGGL